MVALGDSGVAGEEPEIGPVATAASVVGGGGGQNSAAYPGGAGGNGIAIIYW